MADYEVRFDTVTLSLRVTVFDAESEEDAADQGWQKAEDYLQTLGNFHDISAEATLDGQGADSVELVTE